MKGCGCGSFTSRFSCASCDQKWEDHETTEDTEEERISLNKTVKEDYIPYSGLKILDEASPDGSV
jgi:hypothetical protein